MNAKRRVEDALALDVRLLARQGALAPASRTVVTLVDLNGAEVPVIVCAGSTFVDVLPGPRQLPSLGTSIVLERTPCTFGGTRPWFLCPGCHDRFAVLYYLQDGFECRQCQRLAYATSQASEVERRRLKLIRIAEKAGISYQDAERPKGMSWDRWESYLADYKVTVESTYWEFTRWVDPFDAYHWL